MRAKLQLSLFLLVCSVAALAQGTSGAGAVTGVVRDTYGDGLPDITVVLTNPDLGIRRVMMTTIDGVFDAPALPAAGGYNLQLSRKGYNGWETRNFEVSAGQRVKFALVLEPGTTSALVNPDAAMLKLEDAQRSIYQPIARQQLEELPAPGRRLETFAATAPGASVETSPGLTVFGQQSSAPLLVDGLNATPGFYRNPEIPRQFSLDTLHSAETLSGGFPAAFGRTPVGLINAATRSGSNQFHGSVYAFRRNPSWNANDTFAAGYRLEQKQNITGARLGGPIRPGKLFFLANLEVFNDRSEGLNRILNPLITDPAGRTIPASNCTATPTQCAAVAQLIQKQLNVVVPRSTHSVSGFLKVDYRRNEKNNFTVEANAMNSRSANGRQWRSVVTDGSLLANNGDIDRLARFAKIGWTSTPGPASSNELRFGALHDAVSDTPVQRIPTPGGVSISVAGSPIGASTLLPAPKETRFQLTDNLTLTRNSHTLLFGGDLSRSRFWLDQVQNHGGSYSYATLTALAQDFSGITVGRKTYSLFTQGVGEPGRRFATKNAAVYVQDVWRPRPSITTTLGLRWEKTFMPQPAKFDSTYYKTGSISSPNLGFVPRVGISYRLRQRTVFRAGYGMFLTPFSGEIVDRLLLGAGQSQPSVLAGSSTTNSPVFPYTYPYPGIIPSGLTNITFLASEIRNPYTSHMNFSIERDLGWATNLEVSYIASRGVKQLVTRDTNLVTPNKGANYIVLDAAGKQVNTYTTSIWTTRNDPSRARLLQHENGGDTWYNAFALQLRKRTFRGFGLQASYTWSHAIDDLGGAGPADTLSWNMTNADLRSDKGDSPIDQRHRAAIQWIWQPAFYNGSSAVARHALNGWEISSTATFASGRPVTPLVIVNGQQFSGASMLYTNSLNGSGGWNRVPFQPVGSLRTNSESYLNGRLTRTFAFTERVRARLLFEAFNLLNRQRATSVSNIAYIATSGVLRPVAGVGQGTESFSYPDGTTARRAQVGLRIEF